MPDTGCFDKLINDESVIQNSISSAVTRIMLSDVEV